MAYKNDKSIYDKRLTFYTGSSDPDLKDYLVRLVGESYQRFERRKKISPYFPLLRSLVWNYTNYIYRTDPRYFVEDKVPASETLSKIVFLDNKADKVDIISFEKLVLKYWIVLGSIFTLRVIDNRDGIARCYLLLPNYTKVDYKKGRYQLTSDFKAKDQDHVISVVQKGKNNFLIQVNSATFQSTVNPVLHWYIDINSDGISDSIMTDAINIIETIYNLESIVAGGYHRGYLNPTAIPMDGNLKIFYQENFPKAENPDTGKTELDFQDRGVFPFSPGAEPKILSTDGGFFESVRAYVKDLKEEAKDCVNQRIVQLFSVYQSNLSKQMELQKEMIAYLFFSNMMEKFSEQNLKLITGRDVKVEYNKVFNIFDSKILTENIIKILPFISDEEVKKKLENILVKINLTGIVNPAELKEFEKYYSKVSEN